MKLISFKNSKIYDYDEKKKYRKEKSVEFVPPIFGSIVCRSADWAIEALASVSPKLLIMKVINNCNDLSPFPFPLPTWRKIGNVLFAICTWPNSSAKSKILSRYQFQGKNGIWISQVGRVNHLILHLRIARCTWYLGDFDLPCTQCWFAFECKRQSCCIWG